MEEKLTDNIYVLVIMAMVGSCMLSIAFILIQIRSKNSILQQKKKLLDAQVEHQKELLRAIITSQETERKRIGMDLHDEVGSALSSLRLIMSHAALLENNQFNVQCKQIIDQIIQDVRNISHNLSPLTAGAYSFYDAVEDLCAVVQQSGKINIRLLLPEEPVLLEENTALAIYRVMAELMNNTIKHATADNIVIEMKTTPRELQIDYADDGIGLKDVLLPEKKGMGLHNIESRLGMSGAVYTIAGSERKGFAIHISLPLS
ncbi:sensor histidine kinase [Chitinophaga flava]|uniref:histidine kinase n=1 Tax=Chitinophaga flava TaxID=2259036 RepID=A0A365XV06_9BACT|nr:ATP-binding protein [Chitinophaga flava]RBL90173.1 hypothetical protein DF182_27280 [Chitinophaga flava]